MQQAVLRSAVSSIPNGIGGDEGPEGDYASAEGLGNDQDIRDNVFMLTGKHLAGSAHARLDFIEDEERLIAAADLSNLLQIPLGGTLTPPSP